MLGRSLKDWGGILLQVQERRWMKELILYVYSVVIYLLSKIHFPKNSKFAYLVLHFDFRFMASNRETSKNLRLDTIKCLWWV